MADDEGNDASDDAPDQTSRPKQSGLEQKSLSDETVERVKGEILFGVGYKRPPKQHQFKKGQSGNPKGRPRSSALPLGDRSANALALEHANRLITVRDGEEIKQIRAIDAVFRAQIASALKGNAYAQKQNIERYDRAGREKRRKIEEEIDVWEHYVAECRAAIAEAERKGEAPPTPLPHPDDVVIDAEKGVRFIGPVVEEQVHQLEETCWMRDMLILQDALDWREVGEPDSDDRLDKPGTALLFAMIFNRSVPDRFKLSDSEITIRMLRYDRIPKRQLVKNLYRGWRSLGVHPPRGRTSPSLRVGRDIVALRYDLLQRLTDGRLDIANITLEEIEAEITAVMLKRQLAET